MNIPDHTSESVETVFFGLKDLNALMPPISASSMAYQALLLTCLYQLVRSGSGMNIPDLISKSLETIFRHSSSPSSLPTKIRIRDEHSGSYFQELRNNFSALLPPSRSIHLANSVLRIRDVIPGSDFFPSRIRFFPSRIRIKEFKYFNPKNCFLSSRHYPGSGSATL
jgi:hypothetical protein